MKRSVLAEIISATVLAAAAACCASCNWLPDWPETGKSDEVEIPMDEVLTVEEFLAGDFAGDTVWVSGFIVGGLDSGGSVDFGCTGSVIGTAVILADAIDCSEEDECMALQLTKSAHKEVLALDSPANRDAILGHEIYVQGKATTYKKIPALTNLCQYKLE